MKLQFEHNLDYQAAAIQAVCDLFAGQEVCRTEFTVTAPRSIYAGDGARAIEGRMGHARGSDMNPGCAGPG